MTKADDRAGRRRRGRPERWAWLAVLCCACLLLITPRPLLAQAPAVAVETQTGPGYARLLLIWPGPAPALEARIFNGVLIAESDAAFAVDLASLSRSLDPYVALARQDADGRTLRLAMKRAMTVSARVEGRVGIVEMRLPDAAAPPPVYVAALLEARESKPAPVPEPAPEPEAAPAPDPAPVPPPAPD
ncbi:MAG: hypothetical protein HXY25_07700, partial [Alphaproteobacteria bacterium]|nr:hypothetical protein [Alphaproteobacteria bacterium]